MDNEIENTTVTGAGKPHDLRSKLSLTCHYSGCPTVIQIERFVFEDHVFCSPDCVGFHLLEQDRIKEL